MPALRPILYFCTCCAGRNHWLNFWGHRRWWRWWWWGLGWRPKTWGGSYLSQLHLKGSERMGSPKDFPSILCFFMHASFGCVWFFEMQLGWDLIGAWDSGHEPWALMHRHRKRSINVPVGGWHSVRSFGWTDWPANGWRISDILLSFKFLSANYLSLDIA